jgi:hypothetical protein
MNEETCCGRLLGTVSSERRTGKRLPERRMQDLMDVHGVR